MARGQYSPVATSDEGDVVVQLNAGHPGFSDPVYRTRRNAIARLATEHRDGEPIVPVDYTDEEHGVWKFVSNELESRHRRFAATSFLDAKDRLGLPTSRVPQLTEVTERLAAHTGFRYEPVAGLAPLREFYSAFSARTFYSTQYLRHPSVPAYTPEPDLIHEVVGHANQLADERVATLYELVGEATRRSSSPEALGLLSKVFWFTLEFGVVYEDGEPKAYGAGILSSPGELDVFQSMAIKPLDFAEAGTVDYDIAHFQPVLYSVGSETELFDRLSAFFAGYDDDAYDALLATGAHR